LRRKDFRGGLVVGLIAGLIAGLIRGLVGGKALVRCLCFHEALVELQELLLLSLVYFDKIYNFGFHEKAPVEKLLAGEESGLLLKRKQRREREKRRSRYLNLFVS